MNFSSKYITDSFSSADLFDRMLKTVQSWYLDRIFFDITIKCTDGTIQAHKHMLTSASPYFRSLLYGSMLPGSSKIDGKVKTVANVDKSGDEVITSLSEFKTATVQLFLDCIYQVSTFDSVVDVIEFARFCDYIQVPELFRESLRLAGTELRRHDCVDDLNSATSVAMLNIQWIEAIVVYIQTFVPLNSLKASELSDESRKYLMSSIPLRRNSLPLCFLLTFQSMPSLDEWQARCRNNKQVEFLDFWFSYASEVCQYAIDIDYDFEKKKISEEEDGVSGEVFHRFAEMLDSLDSIHCSVCRKKHEYVEPRLKEYSFKRKSEELVLMLFSYEFHPAQNKLYREFTPQISRFIESARNHTKSEPKDDKRFFLWSDTLCSVRYIRDLRILDLNRYAWHRGHWDDIWLKHIYDSDDHASWGFRFTCCHVMKNDILAVATVEQFSSASQSHLFLLNLRTPEDGENQFTKLELGEIRAMEMYVESNVLFIFEHPWKVLRFDPKQQEAPRRIQELSYPADLPRTDISSDRYSALTFTTYQRILEFKGRIYFIYSISKRKGISISKLNTSTMQWEEQTTKLSDEYWLFDAFVANGKLYVAYGSVEENVYPNGDEELVLRRTQFIAVGCCRTVRHKKGCYEFHLVHDEGNPKMDRDWYNEHDYSTRRWNLRCSPRIVVPKYAFQLDFVE